MRKAESVGDRLKALQSVCAKLPADEAAKSLRLALADESNRVIERAADLIAELEDKSFVADLLLAWRRMQVDPLENDAGCLGKTAIVRALVRLEYGEAPIFREGIEYQQPEPIWGEQKDTAAELRGICALGLVACASSLEVLNRCAVLLADPCAEARAGAARALGALGQAEGAPLLRLKLNLGDADAEVVGECCAAVLRIERDRGVPSVAQFLFSGNADVCVQVALALGESRLPGAFDPLRLAWERQSAPLVRESPLTCIGLLRSLPSRDFLLSLINRRDLRAAADAIKALKVCGDSGDLRPQIEVAVETTADAPLKRFLDTTWPAADRGAQ